MEDKEAAETIIKGASELIVDQNNKSEQEVIKEGTINVQDDSGEWVPCHITVTNQGITLSFGQQLLKEKEGSERVDEVIDFSNTDDEVVIEMLPDHARRSRESKLFPFVVKKQKIVRKMEMENEEEKKQEDNEEIIGQENSPNEESSSSCEQVLAEDNKLSSSKIGGIAKQRDEVILATSNGREMWEFATTIRWLRKPPLEKKIPLFTEPTTTYNTNPHYQDPNTLQNALLGMFTYKNFPKEPVRFEDLARIDRLQNHNRLQYVYYPSGFLPEDLDDEGDNWLGLRYYESDSDDSDDNEQTKEEKEKKEASIIENHEHVFGLFAYICLVGACVHVNEKCFELITSSCLYDLSSQEKWKGNSPFSMLCEGSLGGPSRNYMVRSLWKKGYPKLEGFHANYGRDIAFSILLAKPDHLRGIGGVTGEPVHLDDQKLCRLLRDNGDGMEDNKKLTEDLVKAMRKNKSEFMYSNRQRVTSIHIPKSIQQWGCTQLKTLNLHHHGIFELPDELFDLTSLVNLNLSCNCLFGISHKIANLTNLQNLDVCSNLITELPDTIEQLENITDFDCDSNPLIKPPSAVWTRGISAIRNYFQDMRESGTEVNVDLKVLILGLSEAGKTSLVNGLIDPDTRALTRIGDRTVGIEKRTWVMERGEDEQPVNLLTYDFAGQEEYYITHHLFLGNRALYILAFDLSKYKDELLDSQILLWWESIQDRVCDVKSNYSKTPKVIIVGTHADMVTGAQGIADDILKTLQNREELDKKHVQDRLVSLGKILDKLDPRRATAKNEDDNEKNKKNYKNLPIEKKMEVLRLENEVRKIEHQQECKIALPTKIHAVSSLDLQNFDKLRDQIGNSLTEVGPSGKYFPQVDEHLPASWFRVRKFVRDQSTKKGCECMKLPQYFKLLSNELGIKEDVGRRATEFCHDLGDVLFFDKVGLVFLRPSFLIDVFKLVIRHDHQESTYFTEEMLENGISEDQFNTGKELLLQKGELEEWLLDILWSNLDDDIGPESSIKNNLILLLETFDVATPIEHEGRQMLLVPEFQPKSLDIQWPKKKAKGEFEIQRWICVDRTLPRGLLKRVQVRIIKNIYKRKGTSSEFHLAQNQFHITDDNNAIEVYCTTEKRMKGCPNVNGKPGTSLVTEEGMRLYIRGQDKQRVLSLLSRVYTCVMDTLREFPGLVFDHYAVHDSMDNTSTGLYINLEELTAKRDAGEIVIKEGVFINDLLPAPRSFKKSPVKK